MQDKDTSGVIWEEPPQRESRLGIDFVHLAKQLRDRPGAWGVIATFPVEQRNSAYGLSQAVRLGKYYTTFPGRQFESKTRTVGDAIKVYARFVGSGDPS